MQDNLFIGAIVEYNEESKIYDAINKSTINLYNYEVEFNFPKDLKHDSKELFLSKNYFNFRIFLDNHYKGQYSSFKNDKYKMKPINFETKTENIKNNNRIKTIKIDRFKIDNKGSETLYNKNF